MPPESVPINQLVQVEGTPLHGTVALDPFEFVRTIAVARITMPGSMVRLSAGRQEMSDELHALCFLAGANSIFYGDKLLTTGNPDWAADERLLGALAGEVGKLWLECANQVGGRVDDGDAKALDGVRCAVIGSLSILYITVTADDLNSRMLFQPFGK